MRLGVLLVFGVAGLSLLLLARNRYQAAALQLARLNTVEGVVSSIGADGELNLKYNVGPAAYEIVRSVPINVPKIRAGDTVPLVYTTDRPDSARVRQWSVVYQDSAAAGGFGILAILMAAAGFVMLGSSAAPAITASPYVYAGAASLEHPIELRTTRKEFLTTLVVAAGAFIVAFLVCRYPNFLWTPWLSYPAAALIVLTGLFVLWGAFYTKSIRIRADQNGVAITDSDGGRRFLWTDVAGLKHEVLTQEVLHKSAINNNSKKRDFWYTTEEVGHSLILLNDSGNELLKLSEDTPMEPLQDWLRLRAYIPGRTGLTVHEEIRKSPLDPGRPF